MYNKMDMDSMYNIQNSDIQVKENMLIILNGKDFQKMILIPERLI
jgi:hypothetical protein